MKNAKKFMALLLASVMVTGMTGCSNTEETTAAETTTAAEETTAADGSSYDYSAGLDDNGYFEGVKALDYVTLPEYTGIEIDYYTHNISDDELQTAIDSIMAQYATAEQITDRAVEDGDTVNIDYVGSIDGVEFEGGSTLGAGTSVTIGVTSYIDDFLEQLIGHKPGETFDVEVTFPEDYGQEDLNGKDAVFVTTINYIEGETITPELTDEFVVTNFQSYYGWSTAEEMKDTYRADLQASAIQDYVIEYLMENSTVTEVPDSVIKYSEDSYISYYDSQFSSYYGMDLETYLTSYYGITVEEFLADSADAIAESAKQNLILQAIAEDMKLEIGDEDIKAYFLAAVGNEDYSAIEDAYGIGYIKMAVYLDKVVNHITENAVLAEQ